MKKKHWNLSGQFTTEYLNHEFPQYCDPVSKDLVLFLKESVQQPSSERFLNSVAYINKYARVQKNQLASYALKFPLSTY